MNAMINGGVLMTFSLIHYSLFFLCKKFEGMIVELVPHGLLCFVKSADFPPMYGNVFMYQYLRGYFCMEYKPTKKLCRIGGGR